MRRERGDFVGEASFLASAILTLLRKLALELGDRGDALIPLRYDALPLGRLDGGLRSELGLLGLPRDLLCLKGGDEVTLILVRRGEMGDLLVGGFAERDELVDVLVGHLDVRPQSSELLLQLEHPLPALLDLGVLLLQL